MRKALYAQLLRLSFGFYDRHQTGQLMSRATVDLQARPLLPRLRPDLLLPARAHDRLVMAVLFVVEWRLALIALAITPCIVVRRLPLQPRLASGAARRQQKLADVATVRRGERSSASTSSRRSRRRSARRRASSARRSASSTQTCARTAQRALYVPLLSFLPLLAQAAVLLAAGAWSSTATLTLRRVLRLQPLPRDAGRAAAHRSGCGSARRSGRRRPASGSSR